MSIIKRGVEWLDATPRRRGVFLFLYVTGCMVFVFTVLGHKIASDKAKDRTFQRQIVQNCNEQNAQAVKFNDFVDQAVTNAQNTNGLTPAQKEAAIAKYAAAHQAVVSCPPRP